MLLNCYCIKKSSAKRLYDGFMISHMEKEISFSLLNN